MSYVFISYSTKNTPAALNVKNMLQQNGVQCWMAPECIAPGSNYTEAIPAAISGSFAFVLVLSGEAQMSQWVTKELDTALNKNIPVVPFHVDSAALTGQYDFMLAGCQRIEAYERVASAYSELLEVLRRLDPASVVIGKTVPNMTPAVSVPQAAQAPAASQPTMAAQAPAASQDPTVTPAVPAAPQEKTVPGRSSKVWVPILLVGLCAVLIGCIVTIVVMVSRDSGPKQPNNGNQIAAISSEESENSDFTDNSTEESSEAVISSEVSSAESSEPESSEESSGANLFDFGNLWEELGLGDTSPSDSAPESTPSEGENPALDIGSFGSFDGFGSGLSLRDTTVLEAVGYKNLLDLRYDSEGSAIVVTDAESSSGATYPSAMILTGLGRESMATFPLNGKATVVIGEVSCPVDHDGAAGSWHVYVYLDGKQMQSFTLTPSSSPMLLTVFVTGGQTLEIDLESSADGNTYALLGAMYYQ